MRLVILILLLLPAIAHAQEALQISAALLITFGNPYFAVLGYVLMAGSAVYGANQARIAANRERDRLRREYNAGLKDRTITRVASDAPYRYVYGRARVGSDIVAIFTSGDREQYKWIVSVHAAHECDAFEEIYIAGKALGTLDGSGWVTSASDDYYHSTTLSVGLTRLPPYGPIETHTGTSFTLDHTPVPGSLRLVYDYGQNDVVSKALPDAESYLSGAAISGLPVSRTYACYYDYLSESKHVRVLTHLGTSGDTVDAVLTAVVPDWDSTCTLSGLCYTVIMLDLDYQDFQGGLPTIEVLLRGKLLHDVRDGAYPNDTPAWSQNNALVIADYLTSEICDVPYTDLTLDDYVTAANVCDEDNGGVALYNFNGAVTADKDPSRVLEQMAQSMAGFIVKTTWRVTAGKYVAPVLAVTQDDIVGGLSIVGGTPRADLYNGAKGQFIGAENNYVPTDFPPYQNSTYVTADGAELWTDFEFPFTDTAQRIHNLCRIFTEDQRNGFTLSGTFSMKLWGLQIGERITFTSEFLGQTTKVYRLTDRKFSPDQAMTLSFKEDASTIWDLAETVNVDDTQNTNLPNPFVVGLPGNVTAAEDIYETTGSAGVKSKVTVSWTAPADISILDYEVEYKQYASGFWIEVFNVRGTYYEFFDMTPGLYDFRVKARNILNQVGEYTAIKTFEVLGLTAAPADVTGFTIKPMSGFALASWDRTTDLDVKIGGDVEIRWTPNTAGVTWEGSVILPDGEHNGDATNAFVSLATGTYLIKFKDSTGHYSDTATTFAATEAIVHGWTTDVTVTEHSGFTGAKTDVVLDGTFIRMDGTTSGTYEFASTTGDLGTIASRRFFGHIKALGVDNSTSIDSILTYVDTWSDIDGSAVNDTNATLWISISDDNATYSSWMPFLVADFNCRYAKFKITLESADANHNIQISELSVTVKTAA